jgi:hypothetical protein
MSETPKGSQLRYQLVAISRDGSRTVLMTGMELLDANAARDEIPTDRAIVWFQVERMPESESAP